MSQEPFPSAMVNREEGGFLSFQCDLISSYAKAIERQRLRSRRRARVSCCTHGVMQEISQASASGLERAVSLSGAQVVC
ncbi:hypothetical protein J2X61_006816 [Bacillus sp. 3255]|nr:hypothetical protein [Bacillus sp. 3255]